MENKEIIIYTMPTCMFCKKLKDKLDAENISYVEKDYKEHEAEWNKVKMLTGIPIFPTLVIDGGYYCPNRDFRGEDDALTLIRNLESTERPEVTLEVLYENLKTTRTQFEAVHQLFGQTLQEVRKVQAEIGNITAILGKKNNDEAKQQIEDRNRRILEEQEISRKMKEDQVVEQYNRNRPVEEHIQNASEVNKNV